MNLFSRTPGHHISRSRRGQRPAPSAPPQEDLPPSYQEACQRPTPSVPLQEASQRPEYYDPPYHHHASQSRRSQRPTHTAPHNKQQPAYYDPPYFRSR